MKKDLSCTVRIQQKRDIIVSSVRAVREHGTRKNTKMRAESVVFPYTRAAAVHPRATSCYRYLDDGDSNTQMAKSLLGLFGAYDSIWLLKFVDLSNVNQEHSK
jgi:hypothetical protein